MSVIPLTLFFSLLLAGFFVVLFAREQRRRFGSAERDSLLPLADETPRAVATGPAKPGPRTGSERVPASAEPHATHEEDHDHADHDHDDHDHDHDHAGHACGCRDGSRPPCVGCLKHLRRAPASAPLS